MTDENIKTEPFGFGKRMKSMFLSDGRRLIKSKQFYIIIAVSFLIPVIMTVMMSMMDGSVSVDPQTGVESVMRGPENTWQNIGTLPGAEDMGGSEVFGMCNINMVFMGVAIFVCLFISEDFRSGYAKNIFSVRAKRTEYVISKNIMGFICGTLMVLCYFTGSILGGMIAGLSFDLHGLGAFNIVCCVLAKIFLIPVFVSIFTCISAATKQKTWLGICGSLGGGMLLFMTVSLITPLSSGITNVVLCLVGGIIFSLGLGALSKAILNKTALV